MPATRKPRTLRVQTPRELEKELAAVKVEVEVRRAKTSRTLLRLCCPNEWFAEEIDADELWSKAVRNPPLDEVIRNMK